MSELTITQNYLEECQGWQQVITAQPTIEAKDIAGEDALRALKDRSQFDTRNIIISADVALYIPDGTSGMEEKVWPIIQFGELVTRGWLGKLNYVRLKDKEPFLDWAVYDPSVIGPVEHNFVTPEIDSDDEADLLLRLPIDTPLRRPLHFPVSMINYAIAYGK